MAPKGSDRGIEGSDGGIAPGWYKDPSGRDQFRWWDGREWTGEVQGPGPPGANQALDGPSASQASGPVPEPGVRTGHGRRAPLIALATLLVVGGSVAGGIAVGWTLADERAGRQSSETPAPMDNDLPAVSFDDQVGDRHMPDVRGLDADTAIEVLADAGIAPGEVSLDPRPWAGAAGVVVEQTPRSLGQ